MPVVIFHFFPCSDSGKLCDYNIKDGTKVHLFINDKIPPRYATATAASTTSGMAMTSAAGGAQFRPKSIACGSVPLTASSTPLSRKSPSSADTPMDTDQLEIFKQTKLWTALDHTLQPHFRPEDLERVKYQFFTVSPGGVVCHSHGHPAIGCVAYLPDLVTRVVGFNSSRWQRRYLIVTSLMAL